MQRLWESLLPGARQGAGQAVTAIDAVQRDGDLLLAPLYSDGALRVWSAARAAVLAGTSLQATQSVSATGMRCVRTINHAVTDSARVFFVCIVFVSVLCACRSSCEVLVAGRWGRGDRCGRGQLAVYALTA